MVIPAGADRSGWENEHVQLPAMDGNGWPLPKVSPGFPQISDLKELVRCLRNAIAHFNIELIDDGKNQIHLLRVWNINRMGAKSWEAELGLSDIRGIAERFTGLLLERRS